jgi:PII-like signaling protein
VSEDCLKLTTYFGERDRAGGALLADRLLDLHGEQRVRASVLLRGAEGFGRLHHLHTDRLLTLSEDLPVVSIAIDVRARIETLVEPVLAIQRKGLITLERARLLGDGLDAGELSGGSDGMEQVGASDGVKLTLYAGRGERVRGVPVHVAVCELLHRHGAAGATVLLGVDGTRSGARVRARLLGDNSEVPLAVIAVGERERIAAALGELESMIAKPLLTLERARICKRDGRLLEVPHELPGKDEHGLSLWQKLTIYSSHDATRGGLPLHLAIVRRLRESDAAGATSLRGVWGFHGEHPPHGERLLQARRSVPVVTVAIDTPQRIAKAFEIVDELTAEHGLVTSEMVPAMYALSESRREGGLRLARHDF